MAKKVDWYYHRKGCVSCGRSLCFLTDANIEAKETVDARKDRLGKADALKIAHEANKIIVAKGKKVVTFDMKKDPPDDKKLLSALLGPTGNLRAPTIRKGKTLLVGYNDEVYAEAFG